MKLSQRLHKAMLRKARIRDKYADLENYTNDPNQQYLPGLEDQKSVNQAMDTVKKLADLEDHFWEVYDEDLSGVDFTNVASNDINYADAAEDYITFYMDNPEITRSMAENWFDNKGDEEQKEYIENYCQSSYISYKVAKSMIQAIFMEEDKDLQDNVKQIISDMAARGDDIIKFLVDKSRSDLEYVEFSNIPAEESYDIDSMPHALVSNVIDVENKKKMDLLEKLILSLTDSNTIGDFVKVTPRSGIPEGLWNTAVKQDKQSFYNYLVDKEIGDDDMGEMIGDEYSQQIQESIDESHYSYVRDNWDHSWKLIRDMDKGIEPELNEIIDLNNNFQENGDQLESRKEWDNHAAPIIEEIESLIGSLPPEIRNIVMGKLPQSSEKTRKEERPWRDLADHYTKILNREVTVKEVKQTLPYLKQEEQHMIEKKNLALELINPNSDNNASRSSATVTDEELAYSKTDPNYISEHNAIVSKLQNGLGQLPGNIGKMDFGFDMFKYWKAHPEALEAYIQQEQQKAGAALSKYQETQEQRRQQIEKHVQTVPRQIPPLEGKNQQLMMNLVQKLRDKGQVDKNTLQNFLNTFTPVDTSGNSYKAGQMAQEPAIVGLDKDAYTPEEALAIIQEKFGDNVASMLKMHFNKVQKVPPHQISMKVLGKDSFEYQFSFGQFATYLNIPQEILDFVMVASSRHGGGAKDNMGWVRLNFVDLSTADDLIPVAIVDEVQSDFAQRISRIRQLYTGKTEAASWESAFGKITKNPELITKIVDENNNVTYAPTPLLSNVINKIEKTSYSDILDYLFNKAIGFAKTRGCKFILVPTAQNLLERWKAYARDGAGALYKRVYEDNAKKYGAGIDINQEIQAIITEVYSNYLIINLDTVQEIRLASIRLSAHWSNPTNNLNSDNWRLFLKIYIDTVIEETKKNPEALNEQEPGGLMDYTDDASLVHYAVETFIETQLPQSAFGDQKFAKELKQYLQTNYNYTLPPEKESFLLYGDNWSPVTPVPTPKKKPSFHEPVDDAPSAEDLDKLVKFSKVSQSILYGLGFKDQV